MKINDLISSLRLIVYTGHKHLHKEVRGGYVSDLLSDVMGNAKEGEVWITLQTHKNIIAIASLKDLPAIILVKGFKPDNDTTQKAEEEGIVILGTGMDTFHVAGQLYKQLY